MAQIRKGKDGFVCLRHEGGESVELHDRLEHWFFAGRVGDMPTQADVDRDGRASDEAAAHRSEQYDEINLEMERDYAEPDYREGERQLQERKDTATIDGESAVWKLQRDGFRAL